MSPIPPNIENKKTNLSSTENLNSVDQDEVYSEAVEGNGDYVPLAQQVNYTYSSIPTENTNQLDEHNSSSDDSDSDNDDDKQEQIDPDLEFEMLASYRSTGVSSTANKTTNDTNYHLTEVDVFQQKNRIEPEDILLDETKSKQIVNLMSQFRLPESSIPEWAKQMPEDKWKKNLLDSLNAKKTDLFSSKGSS